ncbi:dual-domain HisK/Mak2 protein kinase [Pleurotus eryngii]|uniref:Dual-domain HisK/Mak2 protein kinase n=1 Tax=Pleurotus eryngii TaxID=5323 RepID=A0A9P6A1H1_PLEER|nr:dual-domain HisK/Mak2 protein kinase [Pleurotus eryngii]
MKRKFATTLPTLYFRDNVLSIPGYTFEKATPWEDTGSMTLLAEGSSLKDGSSIIAKISPAHSNGSMCLEREAHILSKVAASPDGHAVTLRMIDYLKIPPSGGDHVVLLLAHPGLNVLGRYLPPPKVNDLLLADVDRIRPTSSHADVYMMGIEEPDVFEEIEAFDIMDLATFLEFAIQATHCLETMHKVGITHREVRANAFHLNSHSGLVRFVHFGNRAISLENFGSPSSLVLRAFDEREKLKVKEALCYLAPEQTGSIETMTQDHRTDLYSLGIMFWTLLVGRGQMPFEGGPLELLHAIVQKRAMPVHEVRRDVPEVLASIVDKLLAKNPDNRYQSAYGLKVDLLECQRRLLATVSMASEEASELIPSFNIAISDRFMDFTMPITLFGRDKELETIRNVIRNASTSFSRYHAASRGLIQISSTGSLDTGTGLGTGLGTGVDSNESVSSSESPTQRPADGRPQTANLDGSAAHDSSLSTSLSPSLGPSDGSGLRRVGISTKHRVPRVQTVVIVGPPGIGKSSMILANQAKWRAHGLWGQAKFQSAESAPFAALLSCLSSVLRQLMVFHTDLHRFVSSLKERLGPQLQNIPLLYHGVPELHDLLAQYDISIETPNESLLTAELRARFQSLVENVFSVIAETRLFALFLDDLHEADDSTLDLISTLVNSRSRMLVLATLRSDKDDIVTKVKSMFQSRAKPTWIHLEPLNYSSVLSLVSKTLHREKDDCAPLATFVYSASSGNAFSARSILTTLQRQHRIEFDWEQNYWKYDMESIEASLADQKISDPADLTFLTSQFQELPEEAKKYLHWAAFFGETFKVTEVALMMDWEDSSGSSGSDSEVDYKWNPRKAVSKVRDKGLNDGLRGSMKGLNLALTEGWLIQRARDMCSFAHDRYRQAAQAEVEKLDPHTVAMMSLRIILMMLHESPIDVYRIAEHAKRCLPLLHENPKRDELLDVLIDAGESAWARGAHEACYLRWKSSFPHLAPCQLAYHSFTNARSLLRPSSWENNYQRTFLLLIRIATLSTWKGDYEASTNIIEECLGRCQSNEDKANVLRLRSRNSFLGSRFADALTDTLQALKLLGVEVNPTPTRREADTMFEKVKNEILAVGFDEILNIPRATDAKTELAIALLNDAGINAYWHPSQHAFMDVIGLTTIQLALRFGMSPGTALGFFWALGAAAERRELYRFSSDMAKLALRIADRHGTSGERCRAQVLYCSMVSGFDSCHIRANVAVMDEAIRLGNSAGDRVYTGLATIHSILTRLYICEQLSELVIAAEECVTDVKLLTPGSDQNILAKGILNCIRVLGGYTYSQSIDTVFDTENFKESEYAASISTTSGNVAISLSWYNAFKVVAFYCVGFVRESAALGFEVYRTRDKHPNHRHVRYSLFFHSLAMIACIRGGQLDQDDRATYFKQVELNQQYIRKWLSPSPVNTSTWVAIVDAEMAAIRGYADALKLYDIAVKLAVSNEWLHEEGWALYLQGCHFVKCGVEGLGSELQRRGISRQAQWGAQGIVNYLNSVVGARSQYPLKRPIFSSEVAVQTESIAAGIINQPLVIYGNPKPDYGDEQEPTLSEADLSSILKWSQDISRDIQLSSALQRLTEIATEASVSQNTCVVMAREAGDYTVATSMSPPQPCQVHENARPLRTIVDPLQRAIIQHTLNTKDQIYLEDASTDPRFSAEASQTPQRSVICIPIFGNRGQTFGVIYFSSKYPFSKNTLTILTLLCQQASVSISNALLFKSVQAGTRENLKMIAAQRDALEAARRSREDALKATKIKSNFLASMSHELRTPFSSFYGLLDLLSGTELNPGQGEIVQTAKQSCELLLKVCSNNSACDTSETVSMQIIDSILDYSKLEASALKLEPSGFMVENIIADCMELLLPMAARKLDLSFNIELDVPTWVYADYARIRQVLMNLIGNAVKFTSGGSVKVICSVDHTHPSTTEEAHLRFSIQDTGIGLSSSDVELLFVPFQQADNSSTRRFGGTGLGLSISRQLVKLMGGAIGVQSELNVGSTFWFTIPVKIYNADESRMANLELEELRASLVKPQPPRILLASASEATLSFFKNIFQGFNIISANSVQESEVQIRNIDNFDFPPLDFVILDDQSETRVDEFVRLLHSIKSRTLQNTKVIHMYTPTTSQPGESIFSSNTPGVHKMTKPPRKARLYQILASLKEGGSPVQPNPKPVPELASAPRTLYGNVLVAEDNPIAQNLIVKQLQRYDLTVYPTSNGEEALNEWQAHPPSFFSVALFDHHMPVCDGVEAAKRLRFLENKRDVPTMLPIVALSADCQESTKQLCLSAGMNAFFSKPLRKNDLLSLLSMFPSPGPVPGPS